MNGNYSGIPSPVNLDLNSMSSWGTTPIQGTPVVPLPGLGGSGNEGIDWGGTSKLLDNAKGFDLGALGESLGGAADWLGSDTGQGVMGALQGLANSWMAFQKLDLARDQFDFNKSAWQQQYDNQASLTNTRLEDRQRARLGANPDGYESVGSYMKKHGV